MNTTNNNQPINAVVFAMQQLISSNETITSEELALMQALMNEIKIKSKKLLPVVGEVAAEKSAKKASKADQNVFLPAKRAAIQCAVEEQVEVGSTIQVQFRAYSGSFCVPIKMPKIKIVKEKKQRTIKQPKQCAVKQQKEKQPKTKKSTAVVAVQEDELDIRLRQLQREAEIKKSIAAPVSIQQHTPALYTAMNLVTEDSYFANRIDTATKYDDIQLRICKLQQRAIHERNTGDLEASDIQCELEDLIIELDESVSATHQFPLWILTGLGQSVYAVRRAASLDALTITSVNEHIKQIISWSKQY